MKMSWQKKEEHIRSMLSRKFGVKLEKRKVPLRGTDNKTYEFDLVSNDGSIVGEIKTYTCKAKRFPYAKIAHTSEACLFLSHTDAKKKLLVLTDKDFYKLFTEDPRGNRQAEMAKADGIQIILEEVE